MNGKEYQKMAKRTASEEVKKDWLLNAATGLGTSLDDTMENNITKLKKRYPDGFDIERSINREEK